MRVRPPLRSALALLKGELISGPSRVGVSWRHRGEWVDSLSAQGRRHDQNGSAEQSSAGLGPPLVRPVTPTISAILLPSRTQHMDSGKWSGTGDAVLQSNPC